MGTVSGLQTTMFLTCIVLCITITHATVISRPNVGVIFNKEQEIPVTPVMWHHTIAMPFNFTVTEATDIADCQHNETIRCQLIYKLSNLFKKAMSTVQKEIDSVQDDINHLATISNSPRSKRGLFDFIGKGAKSLFGVATNSDLKVITKHIVKLQDMVNNNNNDRITDVTQLHSYEVKASKRMDDLSNHLVVIDDALVNVSSQFQQINQYMGQISTITEMIPKMSGLFKDTFKIINWVTHNNVRILTLTESYNVMQAVLHDIPHLMDGKLTPNIVRPHIVHDILKHIDDELRAINSNFRIACDSSYFYRNEHTIVTTWHEDSLYIKFNIPIISNHSRYDLFSVDVFPIPADASNKLFTMLTGNSPYLLLSPDNKTYVELTALQKDRLITSKQTYEIIPKAVSSQNCLVSVFLSLDQHVPKTCNIELLHEPEFPPDVIYHLPDNSYLIYAPTTTWYVKCPARPDKIITHAGLFTISLACRCMLITSTASYMTINVDCEQSKHVATYSSNFLVYTSLFKQTVNLTLKLTEMSNDPIHFELPKSVVNTALLRSLEKKDKSKYDQALHLFNASRSTSSSSLAQFLDLFDVSSSTSILAITSSILIALNLLFIALLIVLFVKFRNLQLLIAAASVVKPSQALTYTLPTPTRLPFTSFEISATTQIILCLSIIILALLTLIVTVCRLSSTWNNIHLQSSPLVRLHRQFSVILWSGNDSMSLPLLSIPTQKLPDNFGSLIQLTSISISSWFYPYVNFEWRNSSLETPLGETTLPKFTYVGLSQALRLRRILSNRNLVQLTTSVLSNIEVIAEWSNESGSYLRPSVPTVPTVPNAPDQPVASPLYPQLATTLSMA